MADKKAVIFGRADSSVADLLSNIKPNDQIVSSQLKKKK